MNYKLLAALFLSTVSISVQAEQRWFEIELLMFERNVDIKNITEHLSSKEIIVNTENSINALKASKRSGCTEGVTCLSKPNPTVITSAAFNEEGNQLKRLASSKLQLVEQRKMLEAHASFKPVLHMVWQMPVESRRTAKPLHIFAGKNLGAHSQLPQPEIDGMTTSEAVSTEMTAPIITDSTVSINIEDIAEINPDKWEIDGNFKVYLDHYLYVDSQLIIRKAVTEKVVQVEPVVDVFDDENGVQIATQTEDYIIPEAKQQTVIKEILFDQNRRLRSEEIHYLDHPLMGIIVQIRKISAEELVENLQTVTIVNQ